MTPSLCCGVAPLPVHRPSPSTEGGLDKSGRESNFGDPRARDYEQWPVVGDAQRPEHMDVGDQEREDGGPWPVHVPSEHGPDENAGN